MKVGGAKMKVGRALQKWEEPNGVMGVDGGGVA